MYRKTAASRGTAFFSRRDVPGCIYHVVYDPLSGSKMFQHGFYRKLPALLFEETVIKTSSITQADVDMASGGHWAAPLFSFEVLGIVLFALAFIPIHLFCFVYFLSALVCLGKGNKTKQNRIEQNR